MTRLARDLAALATTSPAQLRERWALVDASPAPSVPTPLLRRLLAQRLQEKRHGALPLLVARELERVAEAYQARQMILASPDQSIAAIAANHGRCRTRLGKLAAIGCLAPDIVTAIVEGRQPPTLTARTLQDIDLPFAWADQRALLGFG